MLTSLGVVNINKTNIPTLNSMDLLSLVTRNGTISTPGNIGALTKGNSEAGSLNKGSGIYAKAASADSTAGAVKYGDNSVQWSYGPQGAAFTNSYGAAAIAGPGHLSIASTKLITNSSSSFLLGPGSSGDSNALVAVGPDLAKMDLRTLTVNTGSRISGVRNGTEAFAVVGGSRAYKNGNEAFVVSSGTGCAGITGNRVWVSDSVHGESWADLCECTNQYRGRWCPCSCHAGQSRKH